METRRGGCGRAFLGVFLGFFDDSKLKKKVKEHHSHEFLFEDLNQNLFQSIVELPLNQLYLLQKFNRSMLFFALIGNNSFYLNIVGKFYSNSFESGVKWGLKKIK